tara:strand:- start:4058 stop:4795 length:738 start_codon:yes stop_codon:yes gene_type:complete
MNLTGVIIAFCTSFLCLSNISFGQIWFDISIGGSIGTSISSDFELYNDTRIDVLPKVSSNSFLKIGVNFTETESILVDVGVSNRNFKFTQNDLIDSENSSKNISLGYTGLRILPMYRHTKNGSYIEIGPEFGSIQKHYFSDRANGSISENSFFSKRILRGAFGLGGYILGNERISLVSGLRVLYDFSDLRSEDAINAKFPYQNYEEKRDVPFKAFDFQINFELNISLGFMVRSSCGRRNLLIQWQ